MRSVMLIQTEPIRSSATPRIDPCRTDGRFGGNSTRPASNKAMPAAVPVHTKPFEASINTLTSFDGSPFAVVYRRHPPRENALTPFGVPNHIVPSAASTIEATVFDESPLLVSKFVNTPSFHRLAPPLNVPAHTAPSRARCTE